MPRVVDHDRRREKLLEKTFRLFAKRGYADVTMREVADAAEVSIGSLYHYFDDKDDLFEQMLAFLVGREIERGLASVLEVEGRPARLAALHAFVESRERPLGELLHVALDHQRTSTPTRREVVATGIGRFRAAIRDGLDVDEREADELLRSVLGRLAMARLLTGTASERAGASLPAGAAS